MAQDSSPQLQLDEKWDKAIDLSLRRFSYGLAIGGIGSLLLFRGSGVRTALTAFSAGAGVGSAIQQVAIPMMIPFKVYKDKVFSQDVRLLAWS